MAMRELSTKLNRYRNNDEEEEEEEVWVNHYSSNHQILLVGEGDFSFSCSLATCFRSASNICASSLDSYDEVVRKYKKARSNIQTLGRLGASLLHGVDATKLHFHPHLRFRRFDRVIFNFPHAGFHGKESDSSLIRKHRQLVLGFFHGASHLLRANGEVHVSHKNKAPFCHWNLEELASRCFLALIHCVAFEKRNYPGYENKRGDGSRCDQPFFLGQCTTFKFRLSTVAKELYAEKLKCRQVTERESKYKQQPVSFDHGYPLQTEFEGVSQRPVSFDLGYRGDNNLRQVQDHLVQSRHITSPLNPCYYQEEFEDARSFALERYHARFQDNSIELDKLRYTERSSLLYQDFPFQTNHLRQDFSRLEITERRHLPFQDFPVQATQETLSECSYRFSEASHGIYYRGEGRMVRPNSFPHPYTGESQERSLTRQSYLNIHPPQHWIR